MRRILSVLLAAVMLLGLVPAVAETAEGKEPVTITFGGWGDYFLLREQCDRFQEKYPWITVDVVKPVGKDWYAADLTQLAAENNMPDVFNIEYPYVAYANEWCYDMTELFRNDPEAANYPEWLLKYGVVNDKLITLCSALYAFGIELNLSLLEENNIPVPSYDWTIDEWADIARKLTVKGKSVGMESILDFMNYIIPQADTTRGCLGFDADNFVWSGNDKIAESFNTFYALCADGASLNDYMVYAIGRAGEETADAARAAYITESLGASDNLWLRGLVGMRTNASWNLNWDKNQSEIYSGFDWDFYPFPRSEDGENRTVLLNEYLSISSTCEHPEEAYLLVKYMSYDVDGYEAKVDYMLNYDKEAMMAKYPEQDAAAFPSSIRIYLTAPTTDPRAEEVFQKLMDEGGRQGLKSIYARRNDNGILDPQRYVPQWWNCYYTTEWWWQEMLLGNFDAAMVTEQMVKYNNDVMSQDMQNFGITYGYQN